MIKVKTIIEHMNGHGSKPLKEVGDEYDHPNPKAEIQAKMVQAVKVKEVKPQNAKAQLAATQNRAKKKADGDMAKAAAKKKAADDGGEDAPPAS